MKNVVTISCTIDTTNATADLGMEIWIDQDLVFNSSHITGPTNFEYNLSDEEGEHSLRFVLKGKRLEHTKVSDSGEILQDACLKIRELLFDEISLTDVLYQFAVYDHDYNGNSQPVKDKFFNEMGCNGTVELKFTTPAYIWLLENL